MVMLEQLRMVVLILLHANMEPVNVKVILFKLVLLISIKLNVIQKLSHSLFAFKNYSETGIQRNIFFNLEAQNVHPKIMLTGIQFLHVPLVPKEIPGKMIWELEQAH
jgi:hypothetical protein